LRSSRSMPGRRSADRSRSRTLASFLALLRERLLGFRQLGLARRTLELTIALGTFERT
jgi:hypothetical protein